MGDLRSGEEELDPYPAEPPFDSTVPETVRPWRRAWLAFTDYAGRCFCGVGKEGTASWANEHVRCADAKAYEPPGVRPSDPQPARLETVAQLARDILTAIESHDTHRMRHIEQYALRIIRVAEGTQT